MLSRFLGKSSKMAYQGSQLEKGMFNRVEFKNSWNNLVKMYDLRMWYLQNGTSHEKRMQYVVELENLQKEMNMQCVNISTKRILQAILAFYFITTFICANPPLDWNDHWDPKFDRALYGDLEDGGEEGGDDD